MTPVQTLFTEPPAPTVVNCDWCGARAFVCAAADGHEDGPPIRMGLCEKHHEQLLAATSAQADAALRAEWERRRTEREVELQRQRSEWQARKAAHRSAARGRAPGVSAASDDAASVGGAAAEAEPVPCPQDSEELVASILQGQRTVSPVEGFDPRLEDPARTIARLRDALWPLVDLAEASGVYVDCNPSQTHSVPVAGEVPVQALFRARDLLKRER